ncbi:L,D-transpeptidase [Bdellovibrio bacteriovorus]|uniref:L,D-transpeptidase n=1 Tax=Bdellovibrio bacteriovorus TaxID=959 RepID=UPI0035A8B70B
MKTKQLITSLVAALFFLASPTINAETLETLQDDRIPNMIEELNPFAPNVEEVLRYYDQIYEEETGKSAHLPDDTFIADLIGLASCYRSDCAVWAQVVKSSQRMYLYVNGSLRGSWAVSTGMAGYRTPNFDRHPDGRIYDRYTSGKYPGGDYNGLGNMPYAVFITGGFALHGTPRGNWPRLGTPASHGCIRMHPDNAYLFNRLVRSNGIRNVWITVQ